MRARSMLFGPAARVDFVPKFVASGADVGVLDLEDATPEAAKAVARQGLVDARPGDGALGRMALFVRSNPSTSPHFADDLLAAGAAGATGLVVPKLETEEEVATVRAAMRKAGLDDVRLCGGLETVAGVHRAVEVCAAGLDLAYFGAEDYITDIGGRRSRSNAEVLYARSRVAAAGRLAAIPVLDQVVVDFHDDERFSTEANEARDLGFAGKLCIHPAQVALANAAFTPSDDEVAHARALLAAAEEAEAQGRGVVSFEGEMVDAPVVARARAVVERAEH